MDEYLKHQLREDDLNKLMEKMKNDLLAAMKKDGPKFALEVFKRQSQLLAAAILEAEIQIAQGMKNQGNHCECGYHMDALTGYKPIFGKCPQCGKDWAKK